MKKWVFFTIGAALFLTLCLAFFVPYGKDGKQSTFNIVVPTREALSKYSQSFYFDRFDIVHAYYIRSGWVDTWESPYSYTNQEYPPLGILYFSLPRMITSTEHGYVQAFVVLAAATYVVFLLLMWKLLKELQRPHWYMVALALPSFLYFIVSRFDIFATTVVMGAVLLLFKKKFVGSMTFLGLAMLIKWYPIFLIPFAIAWASRVGVSRYSIKKGVYWATVVFVFVTGATIATSGLDAFFPYAFHTSRSIEVGSFVGVILKLLYAIHIPVGSDAVLMGIGFALFGIQLLPLLYGVLSYADMKRRVLSFDDFLRFSFLAVIIFCHAGKIYSPQWEIWWLPLALLVLRGRFEWTLLIIIDVLNFIIFPLIPIFYQSAGVQTFYFDAVIILHMATVLLLSISIAKPLFAKYQSQQKRDVRLNSSTAD